jgi:heme-degrading monooxygenase HmoA
MIIRVFRAVVHDGMQQEFEQFLRNRATPLLQEQAGMLSMQIGTPMEHTPNEFLVTSVWQDLESLKGFTGEQWQEPVIDPSEEHILVETFLHHYFVLEESK